MLFEELRKRRWRRKLSEAEEQAFVIAQIIKCEFPWASSMYRENQLVSCKKTIRKYKSLLGLGIDNLENEIEKILRS